MLDYNKKNLDKLINNWFNFKLNINKYKQEWQNNIKWKWNKFQDNGNQEWDLCKKKSDKHKIKIILFKIKLKKVYKKNKD